MNMPSNPPFRDIMQRTMANLKFVEQHQKRDGPFEVTQLVNSFLSVLVHPWENHEESLSKALNQNGLRFPAVTNKITGEQTAPKILLSKLRDGMAHGNVTYNGSNGEIESLTIWNVPYYLKSGQNTAKDKDWEADMRLNDLRQFLRALESLINSPP